MFFRPNEPGNRACTEGLMHIGRRVPETRETTELGGKVAAYGER